MPVKFVGRGWERTLLLQESEEPLEQESAFCHD